MVAGAEAAARAEVAAAMAAAAELRLATVSVRSTKRTEGGALNMTVVVRVVRVGRAVAVSQGVV